MILGDLEAYKSSCHGDSGGGLYVKERVNGQTKMILIGIVSYGTNDCLPFKPG